MDKDPESRPIDANAADASEAINDRPAMLESLYAQANAAHWMLAPGQFAAALERSAQKALAPIGATTERLEQYLRALHLEDLALATACSSGIEAAWEHFIATYRTYLRSAAAAILRCKQGSAEACDLADSLFSELYGLADRKTAERSLFRYFHGRSSLKTWLRAVLAQRHIDSIRAGRRFASSGPCSARFAAVGRRNPSPRYCYIERFRAAAGIERRGDRSLFRIQRRRHAD